MSTFRNHLLLTAISAILFPAISHLTFSASSPFPPYRVFEPLHIPSSRQISASCPSYLPRPPLPSQLPFPSLTKAKHQQADKRPSPSPALPPSGLQVVQAPMREEGKAQLPPSKSRNHTVPRRSQSRRGPSGNHGFGESGKTVLVLLRWGGCTAEIDLTYRSRLEWLQSGRLWVAVQIRAGHFALGEVGERSCLDVVDSKDSRRKSTAECFGKRGTLQKNRGQTSFHVATSS